MIGAPDPHPLAKTAAFSLAQRANGNADRSGTSPKVATLTGILDRVERGGWMAPEREAAGRRAVLIQDRDRAAAALSDGGD